MKYKSNHSYRYCRKRFISSKNKGFTLFEMAIALLIVGILLSYAIPSYREFGLRQKVTNEANELLGDLMYARVTAVKEGQSVSVVSTNGNDWSDGWTITLMANNLVLRQKQSISRSINVAGVGDSVVFSSLGSASTTNNIVVSHADVTQSVALNVAASGMVVSREH